MDCFPSIPRSGKGGGFGISLSRKLSLDCGTVFFSSKFDVFSNWTRVDLILVCDTGPSKEGDGAIRPIWRGEVRGTSCPEWVGEWSLLSKCTELSDWFDLSMLFRRDVDDKVEVADDRSLSCKGEWMPSANSHSPVSEDCRQLFGSATLFIIFLASELTSTRENIVNTIHFLMQTA